MIDLVLYEIIKNYLLATKRYYYRNLSNEDIHNIVMWLDDEGIRVLDQGGYLEVD